MEKHINSTWKMNGNFYNKSNRIKEKTILYNFGKTCIGKLDAH